jgi:hypothetical protein
VYALDELKTLIGVTTDDHDAVLTAVEAAVVAFVEGHTGRWFGAPAEFVGRFSGGVGVLWLAETPAADPAPVVETNDTGGWVAVDGDDYEVDGAALHHTGTGWPRGVRNIRVTYTAGYAPGEEPADIRGAVLDLVALRYRRLGKEGLSGESIGGYSYSVAASHVFSGADLRLVPGLAATLDRWRRVRVG